METLHSLSLTTLSQTSVSCLAFEILEIPGADSALGRQRNSGGETINQRFSIMVRSFAFRTSLPSHVKGYRRVCDGQSQMRDM